MIFRRFLHSSCINSFSLSENLFSTSLLATLRKKTGYSISNCKKALEINGNDLSKAEGWLDSQAQQQGWMKAEKLQHRTTLHGLVGVSFDNNKAAMIEVNCETDFVARNEKFQSLVAEATRACLKNFPKSTSGTIIKACYSSEQLGDIPFNGSKLSDLVALKIGHIGENMNLYRGASLCSPNTNMKLAACTHPAQILDDVMLGKYGAVVSYEEKLAPTESAEELPEGITLEKLPKQLCQHIIGMNPQSLERTEGGLTGNEETALLHQEFVANPDYTVGEILDQVGWKVSGFIRFECGDRK